MSITRHAVQYRPTELSFQAARVPANPFAEAELDVVFASDDGEHVAPAFWAGGNDWRVRFAPPAPGQYTVRPRWSDPSLVEPDAREVTLDVKPAPPTETNPLYARGPVRVSDDRRHFVHADGTPFFWLGDTWWMGFTDRLDWPDGFQALCLDRRAKGYSVIQIVAGLLPDMDWADPRGANAAGLPWDDSLTTINPAWWDLADVKLRHLVNQGLLPCVVGCWGYYLPKLGPEKMKRHWRYIVARWGAYPVVWCLAGEAAMAYYQTDDYENEVARQKAGWTELGRFVRQIDAHHRPVTIHPTQIGRDQLSDDSVLDFDMLQCGHYGLEAAGNIADWTARERDRQPAMPVVIGEVNYEGIWHGSDAETQRLCFWVSVLSGAAGLSYGANGLWQLNEIGKPYGPSPHGATWGGPPWPEAAQLPGGRQVGIAADFLRRYPWHEIAPHPEWVSPRAGEDDWLAPHAGGIPGKLRLIYTWHPILPWARDKVHVEQLEADVTYRAFWFDTRTGAEHPIGPATGDDAGRWPVPVQPEVKDWLLVLDASG